MGNKNRKKNSKESSKWMPPQKATAYFSTESDNKFKGNHPIGYGFLVLLGIVALLLPMVLYLIFVLPYDINSPWLMVGWAGSFIFGIGFFNIVAIVIKQYLGHLVSILSFIIGGILIWISLVQMGLVH